jgi:energy-coupling factor transporter ATP-binding protein EcfA2
MNQSQYNPLESLTLPGIERFEPRGLILVVGPNGSGKTNLLREINHALLGMAEPTFVTQAIRLQKPAVLDSFMRSLEDEGFLERLERAAPAWRANQPHFGSGTFHGGEYIQSDVADLFQRIAQSFDAAELGYSKVFFQSFGGALSTVLFLNRVKDHN